MLISWFKRCWRACKPTDKLTVLWALATLPLAAAAVPESCKTVPPHLSRRLLITLHSVGLGSLALFLALTPGTRNRCASFVRRWYPAALMPFFFKELYYLVPAVNPNDVDSTLLGWEYAMLGRRPRLWLEQYQSPIVTEILFLSYASYYFLPVLTAASLYARGKPKEFDRYIFLLMLNFYTAFALYFAMPALGPRAALSHRFKGDLKGLFFARHVERAVSFMEGRQRDGFPSLHTQIGLTIAMYFAERKDGRLKFALPLGLGMMLSALYCRYHYVPDVFAGMAVTGLIFLTYRKLHRALDGQAE